MQLGMIGAGRMGANLVRRLMRHGHECVVYDVDAGAVRALTEEGAQGAGDLAELVGALSPPRAIWVMVPAGVTGDVVDDLLPHLRADDVIVDGGNGYFGDAMARARTAADAGVHHIDVGVSGGVFGLERGFSLMIGGDPEPVTRLDPIFASLAPGVDTASRTPSRSGEPSTAEHGYLHCGPAGSGHLVKMVHNGIEYGMMAAMAEGMNLLQHAGISVGRPPDDPDVAPLEGAERHRFDLDLAEIAEVWRRGSVISSWLLDLTADALAADPDLDTFEGQVSDSGEGRWTVQTAVELGVPAHVMTSALYARFSSRGESSYADRLLSAMRWKFGGHVEQPASSPAT